jgi:uroporphyrinogen-III synthase
VPADFARRVLVTRPEPGATRAAARLIAAGWDPVVVPLSDIVPLTPQLPPGRFAAVAASSANALRHAPRAILDSLLATPLFAVGDETASAARAAGFGDVRPSAGNAADLARDIAAALGPGERIAYLCGRVRLGTLESAFAGNGIELIAIETYDTAERAPSSDELALLGNAPIAAVLVYSAKAADALAKLAAGPWRATLSSAVFVAISERVAERLAARAAGRVPAPVLVAASPDEDSMFDLLAGIGHEPAPIAGKLD